MRRFITLALVLVIGLCLWAQSQVTHNLRIGVTDEVALLTEFPEIYEAEKLNITVTTEPLRTLDELDFVFANRPVEGIVAWGDSVYSYTDEAEVSWTLWRNHKEIKNRIQRVRVANAYKAFEDYVVTHTATSKRSHGWIWWLFAGLLLWRIPTHWVMLGLSKK